MVVGTGNQQFRRYIINMATNMLAKFEDLWKRYVFTGLLSFGRLVYKLLSPLPEKARLPVSIIGGSVLFYALMVVTNPKTKTFEPREQSWDVKVHKVVFGTTIPEFKSFGEVMAERNIFLRALVDGEVISVSDDLHEGAFIKKGEELLSIDPFEYENVLGEAKAQLISARASLKMSLQDYERAQKLFEKGTVALRYLDERKTDLTVKKANVDRLDIVVRRAQRNLDNTKVVAPFDAYVSKVTVDEGRLVNRNDHIAHLSDASSYEIRFNLSDSEYGSLLSTQTKIVGQPIIALWKVGNREITLKGNVKYVGARIDPSIRGVNVIADVTDVGNSQIRGGAFVEVVMQGNKLSNVASVPEDSLFTDSENIDFVYVITNNRLEVRKVKSLMKVDGNILISDGVSEGETVLTTRFTEAAEGVLVNIP